MSKKPLSEEDELHWEAFKRLVVVTGENPPAPSDDNTNFSTRVTRHQVFNSIPGGGSGAIMWLPGLGASGIYYLKLASCGTKIPLHCLGRVDKPAIPSSLATASLDEQGVLLNFKFKSSMHIPSRAISLRPEPDPSFGHSVGRVFSGSIRVSSDATSMTNTALTGKISYSSVIDIRGALNFTTASLPSLASTPKDAQTDIPVGAGVTAVVGPDVQSDFRQLNPSNEYSFEKSGIIYSVLSNRKFRPLAAQRMSTWMDLADYDNPNGFGAYLTQRSYTAPGNSVPLLRSSGDWVASTSQSVNAQQSARFGETFFISPYGSIEHPTSAITNVSIDPIGLASTVCLRFTVQVPKNFVMSTAEQTSSLFGPGGYPNVRQYPRESNVFNVTSKDVTTGGVPGVGDNDTMQPAAGASTNQATSYSYLSNLGSGSTASMYGNLAVITVVHKWGYFPSSCEIENGDDANTMKIECIVEDLDVKSVMCNDSLAYEDNLPVVLNDGTTLNDGVGQLATVVLQTQPRQPRAHAVWLGSFVSPQCVGTSGSFLVEQSGGTNQYEPFIKMLRTGLAGNGTELLATDLNPAGRLTVADAASHAHITSGHVLPVAAYTAGRTGVSTFKTSEGVQAWVPNAVKDLKYYDLTNLLSIKEVDVIVVNQHLPGTIGPARIIAWQNVGTSQNITVSGTIFTESVADNTLVPYINTDHLSYQPTTNTILQFAQRAFNHPALQLLKRIYTTPEYDAICAILNSSNGFDDLTRTLTKNDTTGKAAGVFGRIARGLISSGSSALSRVQDSVQPHVMNALREVLPHVEQAVLEKLMPMVRDALESQLNRAQLAVQDRVKDVSDRAQRSIENRMRDLRSEGRSDGAYGRKRDRCDEEEGESAGLMGAALGVARTAAPYVIPLVAQVASDLLGKWIGSSGGIVGEEDIQSMDTLHDAEEEDGMADAVFGGKWNMKRDRYEKITNMGILDRTSDVFFPVRTMLSSEATTKLTSAWNGMGRFIRGVKMNPELAAVLDGTKKGSTAVALDAAISGSSPVATGWRIGQRIFSGQQHVKNMLQWLNATVPFDPVAAARFVADDYGAELKDIQIMAFPTFANRPYQDLSPSNYYSSTPASAHPHRVLLGCVLYGGRLMTPSALEEINKRMARISSYVKALRFSTKDPSGNHLVANASTKFVKDYSTPKQWRKMGPQRRILAHIKEYLVQLAAHTFFEMFLRETGDNINHKPKWFTDAFEAACENIERVFLDALDQVKFDAVPWQFYPNTPGGGGGHGGGGSDDDDDDLWKGGAGAGGGDAPNQGYGNVVQFDSGVGQPQAAPGGAGGAAGYFGLRRTRL